MPELSYREAVRDALSRAMREDDDVFVMGEDISEMALAGAAIGAAMQGMRPVAEIMYEDFLTLATEQIVNQAAKHRYMSGGQLTVPVTFRTLYGLKEEVPDELEPIPLGKARVHREGEDVTVIATGRLVHEAIAAAGEAEHEGVSVEVVDPRTLQPLDEDALISSVKKTNRCVVAHEAVTRM